MENYQKNIDNLAKNNSSTYFLNSSSEHAKIVLKTIFSNAQKYIYIFSNGMKIEIAESDEYIESLFSFVSKFGVQLRILINQFDPSTPPKVFKKLKMAKDIGADIIIKKHDYIISSANSANGGLHFTIADDHIIRIEHDITNYLAFGSFNDEERAIQFRMKFMKIFNEKSQHVTEIKLS